MKDKYYLVGKKIVKSPYHLMVYRKFDEIEDAIVSVLVVYSEEEMKSPYQIQCFRSDMILLPESKLVEVLYERE